MRSLVTQLVNQRPKEPGQRDSPRPTFPLFRGIYRWGAMLGLNQWPLPCQAFQDHPWTSVGVDLSTNQCPNVRPHPLEPVPVVKQLVGQRPLPNPAISTGS